MDYTGRQVKPAAVVKNPNSAINYTAITPTMKYYPDSVKIGKLYTYNII